MQSIRSHFANNFELIRWIAYLFLGGALNASFAQVYVDYLLRVPQLFQTPLSVPFGNRRRVDSFRTDRLRPTLLVYSPNPD